MNLTVMWLLKHKCSLVTQSMGNKLFIQLGHTKAGTQEWLRNFCDLVQDGDVGALIQKLLQISSQWQQNIELSIEAFPRTSGSSTEKEKGELWVKAEESRGRSKRAWTGSGVGRAGRETNEAPPGVSWGTGAPILRCTVTVQEHYWSLQGDNRWKR